MPLLPIRHETIVSPHTAKEVIQKLKSVTTPPALSKKNIEQHAVFIGSIDISSFRISLKVNAPENFMPIIYGTIDETSMGCIVYVKFRLFFSSRMFLIFWSSICTLVSLFFFFIVQELVYGTIAVGAGALNYFVTVFYFQKKANESHNTLMSVLKMT